MSAAGRRTAGGEGTVAGPREFLQRFRPVGTPGAAAPAGVPADRVSEISAELEPVFALLAETQARAARLEADAATAATATRHAADEQARAIVAEARGRAAAERADVAARAQRAADEESARAEARADEQADDLRARAEGRLPAMVERVVAAVRADLVALAREGDQR